MSKTIFSEIIAGKVPCHVVYEDDMVLAFLDVFPVARGHTLVIPKEAAETLGELSDESAAAVGRVLPRICRAVAAATGVADYNVLQNNGRAAHQAVFHVHFHVIPKPDEDRGLGVGWPSSELDHDDGDKLAKDIAARL